MVLTGYWQTYPHSEPARIEWPHAETGTVVGRSDLVKRAVVVRLAGSAQVVHCRADQLDPAE